MLKRISHGALGLTVLALLLMAPPVVTGQQPAGPLVKLQAATFDPLQGEPAPPPQLSAAPQSDPGVYLIQFQGPIQPAWKRDVTAAGAKLFDYVPDYAFIARMDAAAAQRVTAMPAVRWVGPYQPAFRINPALQTRLSEALDAGSVSDSPVDVRVSTFPGELASVREAVLAAGGNLAGATETEFGGTLRATLSAAAVADLARRPAVRWIEPALAYRLSNDVARRQSIMDVERVWDLGLFGNGQVVAFSDSGLDVGDFETLSADFQGRVLAAHSLGESHTGWNDPLGHGTHVAGSIAGSGALSGSDPAAHDYASSLAGMAPEATLVVQAFGVNETTGEIEGLPEDLNELFQPAYDDGTRIHSNSWGGSNEEDPGNPYGGYTLDAQQADQFTWSHRDMTILFAAGNAGKDAVPEGEFFPGDGVVDADSMNIPGTAKNVIAVGASESLRPPEGENDLSSRNMQWILLGLFDFWRPPIAYDYVSDDVNGMAAFSSRGPADDGRIKPDVVAPGTNIVSARSHDPAFDPFLGSWGAYEDNQDYVYNGGTSMATPLVAGTAALVREWYVERQGVENPSSALIKATLINGAVDMSPGQYGTGDTQEIPPRPNSVEGWGRVNLHRSLVDAPPRTTWFDEAPTGLQTGDEKFYGAGSYDLNVVSFVVPLRVTLVWTDYPGSPAAQKQLVNDLDLTVIDARGREWYGNSVAGDRTNNVEGVEIALPARGRYHVLVEGHNVPYGPQPYALVVSGGFTREGLHDFHLPFVTR